MTTSVRIKVPQEAYDALRIEQEKRKKIAGKKTAIADIMLEYCCNWMQNQDGVEQLDSVQEGSDNNHYNRTALKLMPTTTDLMLIRNDLESKQKDIKNREDYFIQLQSDFNDKILEFSDKKEGLLKLKSEALDTMEKARAMNLDNAHNKWALEIIQKEIDAKSEVIQKQETELKFLRSNVLNTLELIAKNTESNFLTKYILPVLPSVLTVFGFIYTNKKIANMKELRPIQAELNNIYKKLKPEDQKMLDAHIKDTIEKNVKNEADLKKEPPKKKLKPLIPKEYVS